MSELTGQWGTVNRGRELMSPFLEQISQGGAKAKNKRQGRKGEKYSVNSAAEKGKGNKV